MIVGRGKPLVVLFAIFFLGAERLFPGRPLPHSPSWYARAILLNLVEQALDERRRTLAQSTRSFERMDFRVLE